jgi:hypothetical protein
VGTENLPTEVPLNELQSDCQQRWDQGTSTQPIPQQQQQDAEPSREQPTGELPQRQSEG